MLSINISGEMWKKLSELKKDYNLRTYNDVIKAMYTELIKLQEK